MKNLVSRILRTGRRPLRSLVADVLTKVKPRVEVAVGADRMLIDLRDPIICRNLFLDRVYDQHVFDIIERLDLANKIAIDVGANVGLYAMRLSRMVGPGGRVISFEPEARNFDLLQRNRELNGASNVTCVNAALGAARGTSSLSVNPYNWGDHWIADTAGKPEWATAQTIDVVTLDDQLRDTPDGSVAFIKIDVQGYEVEVFRGMEATLRRNPDVILLVEVSPKHLRAAGTSATTLVKFLLDGGFRGWDVHLNRLIPVASPESYELMRGSYWADLLLCRNPALIGDAVKSLYRAPD